MPYDEYGNPIDDNPALDFAVQSGGGAPNSSLAVNTGAPANNYLTGKDFKYTAPTATTGPQEGSYDNEGNYVPPYNDPYKGGLLSYNGMNFAAPALHEAGGGFSTPYYEARTNTGDLAAAVMAGEGQGIRLLDSSGNIIYQGTGPDAARDATAIANKLSMEGGKTAAWNIQIEDPANKGTFNSAGYESVDKVKDHTLRNLLVDVVPQIVAAVATGGLTLGVQVAAAAAATIPGSIVQHKSLTDSIFRAAMAAGTTGVLKGTTAGQNVTKGISNTLNKGISGTVNAFTPAATNAGATAAANAVEGTLEEVIINGIKQWVPPSAVNALLASGATLTGNISSNSGQDVLRGGNGDTVPDDLTVKPAPPTSTITSGSIPAAATPLEVNALEVLGTKLGAKMTSELITRALAQGITTATLPEWLMRQGLTPEVEGVDVTGNKLPKDPFNPIVPPIDYSVKPEDVRDIPKDVGTPDNPLKLPPPPPGLLDKAKGWWDALPLAEKIKYGFKGASAATLAVGALSGGGSGGSGGGTGTGGVFKTIAQQRAGLPDIFRAQPGAPRGMFSALGTAGTPYTPRPISNLIPDAAVNTNGSGNPNPSGTAALSDYLRRYPDVAAEAKANPGAYDDVNDDGVIDDNDFALAHYILHGKDEGRTLAVKKGGYIQHPSRDTDMHNSRFQVMRKADGGVINDPVASAGDTFSSDDFVPRNTTSSSAASMMGPLNALVPSQLAQSLAVDPRALAESYRAGATGAPQPLSVMQPRQSPYSGYEPGTMGGMYHYGESPTGETQHFNYALAQGSVAPWMASTPTGTGRYNMFGVLVNDGVGTGGTPGGTPGTTTTNTPTPISDAERAKWTAYVNAYPDLAAAFAANPSAYQDFNRDGRIDIADFGLGQYTNYGQNEGRSLTGPAGATNSTTPPVNNTPATGTTPAQWAAYVNNTPDLAAAYKANNAAYGDFNRDGKIDITDFGLGQYTNYGQKEGRSLTGPAGATNSTRITDPRTGAVYAVRPDGRFYNPDSGAVYGAHVTLQMIADNQAEYNRNNTPEAHQAFLNEANRQEMAGISSGGGGAPEANWDSYVNAYPDLAAAFAENNNAYGDFNNDGKIDITDFGLGQYTNYGENEGRAYDGQYKKGGPTRSQFAVRGPGTGRSDSIPAALSDGEYVMDAETVALLGDGSSKAGAKKLDAMRGNLRKHKGRSLAKGRFSVNAKAPEAYLSGGRT